ncbi:MAG: M14 family zinc carboxypeptidase [Candidatus Thorarchaeota archaeon]
MTLNQRILLCILFLGLILILPQPAQTVPPSSYVRVIRSVERTWDDIFLLYPDQFHNSTEIMEEIANFETAAPELVDVSVIGQSVLGKDIQLVRITNEAMNNPKAGVFYVAQHHAREQITVEATLRFIQRLLNNYGEDPQLTHYVDSEEIYIIPTLNPDSNDIVVEDGNEWIRKNARPHDDDGDGKMDEDKLEDLNGDGDIYCIEYYDKPYPSWDLFETGFTAWPVKTVTEGVDNDGDGLVNEDVVGFCDLNRNYDSYWNDSSFTSGWGSDTTSEIYPGTAPFSEPETAALRDFVLQHKFAASISLHSGINETYFPVLANDYYLEPALYQYLYNYMRTILPDRFHGGGSQINSHYASSTAGEWSLWMHEEAGCKVPMTFEIYHNTSALREGECYFLLEENTTHQVWNWTGMYEHFAPEESEKNFNNLWEDISPVMNYWMEMTPRLDITVKSTTVSGLNTGDLVTLEVDIKNLSPKISTIEMLTVTDENYNPLTRNGMPINTIAINPEYTLSETIELDLPSPFTGDSMNIMIGNNYTGFQSLVITPQSTQTTSSMQKESSSSPNGTSGLMLSSVLLFLPLITILRIRKRR